MPARNRLKGVLASFLGTYMSRYSDYQGYWLFGFLISDRDLLEFDLLGEAGPKDLPEGFADQLAKIKFAEQLQKHGLTRSSVQQARLLIERPPEFVNYLAGDHIRSGFNLRFLAGVVTKAHQHFELGKIMFVTRHNPHFERRCGNVP
jgi:hypothetical protein